MDIEHHDLATDTPNGGAGGIVDDKQTLIDMVYGCCAREFHFGFGMVAGVRTACERTRLAQDIVNRRLCQSAIIIEFENLYSAISVTRNKKSVMDAIQRPLWRSPHTVTTGTTIGHPSDEGRISPEVFLTKKIARRLAVLLGQSHHGQKNTRK